MGILTPSVGEQNTGWQQLVGTAFFGARYPGGFGIITAVDADLRVTFRWEAGAPPPGALDLDAPGMRRFDLVEV